MSETEFERGYRLGQRDASEVTDQFRAKVERLKQEQANSIEVRRMELEDRHNLQELLESAKALLAAMTAERDRLKAEIDQIRILQRMRPV